MSIYPTSRSPHVKSARRLAQSKSCRTLDWSNPTRSVLDCGCPLPLFHTRTLSFGGRLKFIRYLYAVASEAVNGFHHGNRSRAFKPSRRTPRILIRHVHQSMFHRVLVNVIQARQIRFLACEPRLTKIEPDLPTGSAIKFVDPTGSLHMKNAQRVGKIGSIVCVRRRVRDEMVVVRDNGPSLRLPAEIARYGQQTAMQYPQAVRTMEVMSPLISAGGNEVSSTQPGRVEPNEKAAEGCRSPKAGAPSDSIGEREASWLRRSSRRFWTGPIRSKQAAPRPNSSPCSRAS